MASRSASTKFLYIGIGIGGRISRPRPMWRPVRIVSLKFFSVHFPRPVSGSGVRLAVKLTPHGPDHAVLVAEAETIHGPLGFGAGGSGKSAGCPESARVMSGCGPFGPTTHGVWQSWQPEVVTRYWPLATLSSACAGAAERIAAADVSNSVAFGLMVPPCVVSEARIRSSG